MTSRTHDLAAFTVLGSIVLLTPLRTVTLSTFLLVLLANQMGGVAPDIDQPTAPLWRNLPIGGIIGRGVDKLLGGHRFLTHSLLGVGMFGLLAAIVLKYVHPLIRSADMHLVWGAFIVGMLSHLVMDTLTKEGVPWFLPIPIKFGFPPVKRFRITTGKNVEFLVVFPLLMLIDIYLGVSHYQKLLMLFQHHIT